MIGSTPIPSSLGTTITGAISNLNTGSKVVAWTNPSYGTVTSYTSFSAQTVKLSVDWTDYKYIDIEFISDYRYSYSGSPNYISTFYIGDSTTTKQFEHTWLLVPEWVMNSGPRFNARNFLFTSNSDEIKFGPGVYWPGSGPLQEDNMCVPVRIYLY